MHPLLFDNCKNGIRVTLNKNSVLLKIVNTVVCLLVMASVDILHIYIYILDSSLGRHFGVNSPR